MKLKRKIEGELVEITDRGNGYVELAIDYGNGESYFKTRKTDVPLKVGEYVSIRYNRNNEILSITYYDSDVPEGPYTEYDEAIELQSIIADKLTEKTGGLLDHETLMYIMEEIDVEDYIARGMK